MALFGGQNKIPKEAGVSTTSKIPAFFEHLKTYISYYATITTVIGGLWAGFAMYDNWKDGNEKLHSNVNSIMQKQTVQQRADSLLLEYQMEMRTELDEIRKSTEANSDKLNSLQRSYIRYISNDKALTKTDFLEYMEGLSVEEKKSSPVIGDPKK